MLLISPQPFFAARGSPIRVRSECQALAELGFEVDILAFPYGRDTEIAGVRLIRSSNPFGLRDVPIGPSLQKAVCDLFLFWKALRLALSKRYVAIHCVEEAGIFGVFLRSIIECKLIYDKHSDVASYRGGALRNAFMGLYQKIETQIIRRADAVVTGEPLLALTRSLAGHGRVYPVCDVPSSRQKADPARAGAIRRRLERSPHDVVIMYLGNFAAYQGVELMFRAIRLVVMDRPDARFVIIGGSPADSAKWRKWVGDRNAADAVLFVAGVEPEEVPNYLAASDILMSPRAAGSGAPLKHLDYLNANRAIVASDTPANRFYLDQAVALLTGANAQEFADGIIQLIVDPCLRKRLADNARLRIKTSYDYPQLKQGLRACYDALGILGDAGITGETDGGGGPRSVPAAEIRALDRFPNKRESLKIYTVGLW